MFLKNDYEFIFTVSLFTGVFNVLEFLILIRHCNVTFCDASDTNQNKHEHAKKIHDPCKPGDGLSITPCTHCDFMCFVVKAHSTILHSEKEGLIPEPLNINIKTV